METKEVKQSEKPQKPVTEILSVQRLAHFIYMLQSRRATAADLTCVWAYLDAWRDLHLIDSTQKTLLLNVADNLHTHRLKHDEPFEKIPFKDVLKEIGEIVESFDPYGNPDW